MSIQDRVRAEVNAMSAYHVADASGMIKLDAMENPYLWPENLRSEFAERVQQIAINRYPAPAAKRLQQLIRETAAVPESCDLVLGNGSDECILQLMQALGNAGEVVLAPTPTFVMYQVTATLCHLEFVDVPLGGDFALDAAAMLAAIEAHQPKLIFLAYPNNPTGNLFDEAAIRSIIEVSKGVVVIDEAYLPFAGVTMMQLVEEYDNVVVMRTLSKYGLAGLRIGYLVARPELATAIDKVRLPYNLDVLSVAAAELALENDLLFRRQAMAIQGDRQRMLAELEQFDTLRVYPSSANFILVRIKTGSAQQLAEQLRERGILIKRFAETDPALGDCLRLTVGTPEENTALLDALRVLLAAE